MVKVTGSIENPIKSTDWHKRLCAQVMMLLASVAAAAVLSLRHDADVLFPMTRTAVFVLLIITFLVARRYLAPRLGVSVWKAGTFGLGAATLTLLYFSVIYSIFETGSRISGGYVTTMVEAIDAMAEIAARVLTNTFDFIDIGLSIVIIYVCGMVAEMLQRLWGEPIRAPRV